tara:strand:+ start:1966 stop:2253 length:288 start_codon:yes stop_codon:yes gene_type:complete
MQSYIEQAINKLAVAQDDTLRYSYIGSCKTEEDFNNITGVDNFNFTWADVQAKATELETADTNAQTEKENLKASARSKLIAGEPLTEEEAATIVP